MSLPRSALGSAGADHRPKPDVRSIGLPARDRALRMPGPPLRCRPRMRTRRLSPVLFALLTLTACDHFAAARASAPPTPLFTPVPGAAARAADPCDVGSPSAEVSVQTLTAADGSCVPPTDLVLYRCDPSMEQVAVADIDGSRRRFLGGAYAVRVDALPPDARQIGVTGSGRI